MLAVTDLVARRGDTRVLDGVSLSVEPGEWCLITGPNGSGKTTLIRHFNGLAEPTSGEVRIDGTPVTDDLVRTRTKVGMVFQQPRDMFVASTVGADVAFGPENLGLDREEIDRRVQTALAAVKMTGREDDRIETLSGGELARVAIAGALAMEPEYLVLDEPFTGLDLSARRSLLQYLDELQADGIGLVVVTHDLRDVFGRADRVIGLTNGNVAVRGPPTGVTEELAAINVRVP